jgi:hypothetical protein
MQNSKNIYLLEEIQYGINLLSYISEYGGLTYDAVKYLNLNLDLLVLK